MDKIKKFFLSKVSFLSYTAHASLFVFLLIFLMIPIQKRYHKTFRSLSNSLLENQVVPGNFDKDLAYYFTDILVLVLFAFLAISRNIRFKDLFLKGSAKYLTLFLGISFLSLLLSDRSHFYFQYFQLLHFSISVLFFCLLIQCFSSEEKHRFIFCAAFTVLFISLFECTVGISQYFLQKKLGLKMLGEVPFESPFSMSDGTRWLPDRLLGNIPGLRAINRASGTFPHANIFGGFLSFAILLTYFLIYEAKKKKTQVLLSAALFLQFFTLCITYSRSALVAWAIVSFIWFVTIFFKAKEQRKTLYALAAVTIATVAICFTLFYPQFSDRGGIVNYNQNVQAADTIRVQFHTTAKGMLKEHPLLGIGFNNFLLRIQEFAPKDLDPGFYFHVHNIYYLVAAEEGMIGFICFACFIGSILFSAIRGNFSSTSLTFFCIFLAMLFIGFCDFYPFLTQHGRLLFFGAAGLLVLCGQKKAILTEVRMESRSV